MVKVGKIHIGEGNPLVLIAGPCVVESRTMVMQIAERIDKIARKHRIPFIFKASYKKANRTSGESFSGMEMDDALQALEKVRKEIGVPVLTDVHSEMEVVPASEVVDVLQVPAFLCRQTELLHAVGRTGKVVNIKKGQFLAPQDIEHQAKKVQSTGNKKILLTERGTTFGYHNLVVDMRGLSIMRRTGFPVILDATHSVQLPGGGNNRSGGQPEFIFPIARAGVAVGIDGLFVETHPNPPRALSDADSQLPLSRLEELIRQTVKLDHLVKDQLANDES